MFDFLSPSDPELIIECSEHTTCTVTHSIVAALVVFAILLTGFAYTTVLERRLIAWIQDRIGPNRAGPLGLLQPVADGLKLIFKQDVTPMNADRVVYWLAPVLKVIPALIVLAVIPLGPPLLIPWIDGNWYRVAQGLIDPEVGILWILAITSISVYGVTMAGWASANKYSMIGSLRSAASMISYELSLGASFAVPAMLAGSLSAVAIVEAQSGSILNWFIFQNPLAGIIMAIALLAEVNRAPFDLPEAEQELVAGHMTEYSGMKFALFFMGEYINMIGISVIFASMFLGGYNFILTDQIPILGLVWLALKVVALLSIMIWIRATLPRMRYDQLMAFGWKVMLPLSLIALGWTSSTTVFADQFDSPLVYAGSAITLFIIVAIGLWIFGRQQEPTPAAQGGDQVEVMRVGGGGIGYLGLQFLGSLVAVPFLLFQTTQNAVDNLSDAVKKQDETDTKQ
ncbi:MAG: NADH-quinone oxidoreductase subunit NuoH [Anaerolineales bacterium]